MIMTCIHQFITQYYVRLLQMKQELEGSLEFVALLIFLEVLD